MCEDYGEGNADDMMMARKNHVNDANGGMEETEVRTNKDE